jgi:hypothetical protein
MERGRLVQCLQWHCTSDCYEWKNAELLVRELPKYFVLMIFSKDNMGYLLWFFISKPERI